MMPIKQSDEHPLLPDSQLPPPQYILVLPPLRRNRVLSKSWRRCITCSAISLLFLIAAVYILWPSNPIISIVRLRLDSLHFHTTPKISIDVTLDLTAKVKNRDFYSFHYDSLTVAIGYRGKTLGSVISGGGHLRARGSSFVNATLELERVEILSDVILLIEDLAKGSITFYTVTEMSGKLGLFFFQTPLKAKISCELKVNTRNQTISRQNCYPEL